MAKAGRPKKGIAGLPAWFNIEKYRPTRSFHAAEWFEQLAFRRFVADWHAGMFDSVRLKEGWEDLLKSDPIVTKAGIKAHCSFEEWIDDGSPTEFAVAQHIIWNVFLDTELTHGVMAVTNGQICEAYGTLPKNKLVWRQPNTPEEQSARIAEWISFRDFPFIDPRNDHREFIRIDWSLPPRVLIAEFENLAKSKSLEFQNVISPYFRSPDFSNWYNSGVLPYLDLRLWETATGETFQWTAFADALSHITDKAICSESSLQKITRNHAEKLVDVSTLSILKAQAARERSGTIKKSGKLFVG